MTGADVPGPPPAGPGPADPEELEAGEAPTSSEISARTTPGAVELTVSGLEASLAYYQRSIGLEILDRGKGRAILGTGGRELVGLVEEAGARSARGYTGLYHLALLLPDRVGLARFLAAAIRARVALVGLSDHFVSEAIYLADPDGHGIEIYCDRPREQWTGRVAERMTTLPLDVEGLLGELDEPAAEPFDGLAAGTVMGHVHLKVSNVADTVAFYRDVLGFGLMAQLGSRAAFLAAGGYHHHIGANTWESAGALPPPPGTAALRHATIVLPSDAERDRVLGRVEESGRAASVNGGSVAVTDPSGNVVRLAVG